MVSMNYSSSIILVGEVEEASYSRQDETIDDIVTFEFPLLGRCRTAVFKNPVSILLGISGSFDP